MKKNICCGLGMALAFAAMAYAQDTYYKISKVGTEENQSFDILLNNEVVTEAKQGDWLYVSPIVPDGKMFMGYTLYDKYGETVMEQVVSQNETDGLRFLMSDHDVYVKASYESLRYSITAKSSGHGTVAFSFSDRAELKDRTKPGYKVTVTPTADKGYKLESIKVSRYLDSSTTVTCTKNRATATGALPGVETEDGSCIFRMPYFDVDIMATFVAENVDVPKVHLKGKTFKVEYELNGGSLPDSLLTAEAKKFLCDSAAFLPTPTKKGFDFVGWSLENKLTNSYYALDRLDGSKCPDTATTVYAIWTAKGTCMEQTAIALDADAKSPVCASNIKCALIHSNAANQDSVCNGVVWTTDLSILPSSSSAAASSSSEVASSSSEVSSSSAVEPSSSGVAESSSATESSSSEKPASSSSEVEPASSATSASSSADVASSSSEKPVSSSSEVEPSSSETPASSSSKAKSSSSEKPASSSSEVGPASSATPSSSATSASSSADAESSSSEKPVSSSTTESSSSGTPVSSSSKVESSSSAKQNTYYKITKVGTEENQSFDILLNGVPITEAKQGDWPEIVPIVPEGKMFISFTVYEKYGETEEEQVELKVGKNGMRFLMQKKDVFVKVTYGPYVESSSAAAPASSSAKVESSSAAKPASSSVKAESSSAAKPTSSSAKATSSSGKSEASSSSKAKSSSSVETVVESVENEKDLPECTKDRENETYYVTKAKKVFVCKDKKWTKFDPNGIPVVARAAKFSAVANGRSLQISGAKVGASVNLLDMQGRVIYSGSANAANFSMNVPRGGTFVLRIGSQQKVVNIR